MNNKIYSVNGTEYEFTDVHIECGILCGRCITGYHFGEYAWLDNDSFQIWGTKQWVQAVEIIPKTNVDNTYIMWGGELRDRLPHGARYYQRGKRW